MRTTVTIDDDILKKLKERCRQKRLPFKKLINDTLRMGLWGQQQLNHTKTHSKYKITPHLGGQIYVQDLDDITEVIATVEGEDFK